MFNLARAVEFFVSNETQSAEANSSNQSPANTTFRYFNGKAIVEKVIQPYKTGRVRFRGSWWPAQCEQNVTLVPGEMIEVVGIRNITLLVRPKYLREATH